VGKLVRDGVPDIIRDRGGTATTRVLDDDAFRTALFDKLVEEAEELRDAPASEVLEECADVYEVLLAIASVLGVSLEQVAERAATKTAERGGFAERLFLESFT
jgi:predicted house-cleaning noncanonical NTP pyrophosphatase (MazG superfamily)